MSLPKLKMWIAGLPPTHSLPPATNPALPSCQRPSLAKRHKVRNTKLSRVALLVTDPPHASSTNRKNPLIYNTPFDIVVSIEMSAT